MPKIAIYSIVMFVLCLMSCFVGVIIGEIEIEGMSFGKCVLIFILTYMTMWVLIAGLLGDKLRDDVNW